LEHISVLLNEVIDFFQYLDLSEDKIVADFTLGGGGHSEAILQRFKNVKIVAFDKDQFAIDYSQKRLEAYKDRIQFIHSDFSNFDDFIDYKFDGAILDLGISSFHIDDKSRGFSFDSDEPLDMRMDRSDASLSAADIVNNYKFAELQRIFKEFGEISRPNKVVNAIIDYRRSKRVETCRELSEIIRKNFFSNNRKINVATKFFQAIRIAVNDELGCIEKFLSKIFDFMNVGSRLQIISFHSLEDRIVKNSFKYQAADCVCPISVMRCCCNKVKKINILTKKPISPSESEIGRNKRSRSAKLRVAEIIV